MDTDSSHVRLSAVGIVAASLFLALLMRLWFLQGIDRQEFEAASISNRLRVLTEEGPRGRILDRNGKVLVDNRTSIVVALDREPLRELDDDERRELFVDLADTLNRFGEPTKVSFIERRYQDQRYAPQAYVPIAEDVSELLEIYLLERADRFPGVVVERKAIRVYPYGKVAVQLLGYVGEINETELLERGGTVPGATTSTTTSTTEPADGDRPSKPYELGDSIGKSGVERAYEDDLRGVPGKRTVEVDARGNLVDVVSVDAPRAGDDVWLSIDVDLQAHAERLLEAKIHSLRGQRQRDGNLLNAPQGSVVIQDPTNGQILAMASYPDYDPNLTVNGISQEVWDVLNDPNSGQPLVNWAMQGTYAPGSTFKLFSAYAGLRTGFLSPGNDVINDPGSYRVDNCTGGSCVFTNAGGQGNGTVDLVKSLRVSSDVYYYRIADKLWQRRGEFGPTPIQDAAAEFGLGQRTGIELAGENAGRLPTPESRRKAYEARPDLFMTGDWFAGDNVLTVIGQGDVLATPLQLVNAYSTFANGGTRYEPRVAIRVTRPADPTQPPATGEHEVIREIEPSVAGRVEFAPDHYDKIFRGLLGVTQEPGGTAYESWQATPTAWPMAGKTGTAEVDNKADTALFVGWGPAAPGVPPQYAISVVVPEAGFGGVVAAPLAIRILEPVSHGRLPPACTVDDMARCDAIQAQATEDSYADAATGTAD